MKKNLYRVSINQLQDKNERSTQDEEPICFNFESHDDLKQIIARAKKIEGLSQQETQNLAIGIKMLGEVMLENRKHPLFEDFSRHFGQFMKALKKSTQES